MPTTFAQLIAAIQAYVNTYIYANNQGKITGPVMNMVVVTVATMVATFFYTYYSPSTVTIPHVANNSVLQAVIPTAAGQVYVRDGFYAAGDGGGATYTSAAGACSTPDNGAQVQPTGMAYCWTVQSQNRYNAAIWGVKADYNFGTNTGTDNTTTLASAISFSETLQPQGAGTILDLPSGNILSGPQTIASQIRIEGVSDWSTTLVLKHASNAPMLTFSPAGWTFPNVGYPAGETHTNYLRITSVDGSATNATYPNAAGISIVVGNGSELWAYFDYINIYNVPGDGVVGSGAGGLANFKTLYTQGVGGAGIDANSVVDWIFDGGPQISESRGQANIILSGVGSVYFHDLNSFAALAGPGMLITGNSNVTLDGHQEINGNYAGGVVVQSLGSGNVVTISDYQGGFNSQVAAGSFPDIWVYGGSGTVLMTRAIFPAPFSEAPGNSTGKNIQYDISYDYSSTTKLICTDCVFLGGPWNVNPQINSTRNIAAYGYSANAPWTVATLPVSPANGPNVKFYVSDATSCSSRLGSVTGGGSTFCPVIWKADGTLGVGGARVAAGGSGGTNGTNVNLTVTGGTCTTQPVIQGTIVGGALSVVTAYGTPGLCSVLPTSPATVTGNGLSGATVNINPQNNGSWVQD